MHINTVLPETKTLKQIENILITQAKPEGEKSPYFEMAKKYNVKLNFQPFIRVGALFLQKISGNKKLRFLLIRR